jgi:hypothetical protein
VAPEAQILEPAEHRRLGVELYNKTWTLMRKSDRTREDDDEMLHCAHASAYHWLHVGTQAHRARSEWQCSRVYTVLGLGKPALRHARRCLELVEGASGEMEDWDLAAAHEALARAYATVGDGDGARRHLELGRAALAQIADDEDREQLEADLATIPV